MEELITVVEVAVVVLGVVLDEDALVVVVLGFPPAAAVLCEEGCC